MTSEDVFPDVEEGGQALHAWSIISLRQQCTDDDVMHAFKHLQTPEWSTPQHLDAVKKSAHSLNEAARHASNLITTLRRLRPGVLEQLVISGAVTIWQLEHLFRVLSDDAESLGAYSNQFSRKGGQNPAAYLVAEGMRRLFRRLRRPITHGLDSGGGPSTDFGRAVEHAIGAFGLRADWRRPAEGAIETQRKINTRYERRRTAHVRKCGLDIGKEEVSLSGVSIKPISSAGGRAFRISLTNRDDIAPMVAAATMFKSGRDVRRFAMEWAARAQEHLDNAKSKDRNLE